MLHKFLEDWHDTILYLGGVFILLGFFLSYWTGEYQNRYAEFILQEYLSSVSVTGKITLEGYESIINKVSEINSSYEVDVRCVEYVQKPIYALIQKDKLAEYFIRRNVKKEQVFCDYEPYIAEENPETISLQKESDAQIFAAMQNKLPLPSGNTVLQIEAFKPEQRIYEGEALLTICRVTSEEGEYYAMAQPTRANSSGVVYLNLMLENKEFKIPVQVYCYPRMVVCENGHETVNSEEKLSDSTIISSKICPYCARIPLYISCNKESIRKETGANLSSQDIGVTVVYMNGEEKEIFPDCLEWQDSYDKNFCGLQQVTVRYRGKEDNFFVLSENANCLTCGNQCNERGYEDYVNYPYCLVCLSSMELFSGERYEECISSSEEILVYLDKNTEQCFKRGDIIQLFLKKGSGYVSFLQETVKKDGRMEGN